jgi:hypothetical protein
MSQEQQQGTIFKRLNAAGWLAVAVFGILLVGLIGLGARSVFGVNRLKPLATPAPTDEAAGNANTAEELTPATVEALPTPDPDAAWATFMDAIYKCDALEDVGDDLTDYPESLAEMTEGIEDLTWDQEWIEWCYSDACTPDDMICHIRRLAEFGPRNLECQDATCRASVSVQSQGGFTLMVEPPTIDGKARMIVRPPQWNDALPLRLIKGQLQYQPEENTWIITDMETVVLPEPPESPPCDDCDS